MTEAALALLVRAGGRGGDAMDAAIAVATREGAEARVGEGGCDAMDAAIAGRGGAEARTG